jgi:hypothetical protein
VLRILLIDDVDASLATNNFVLRTALLNTGSYFHIFLVLTSNGLRVTGFTPRRALRSKTPKAFGGRMAWPIRAKLLNNVTFCYKFVKFV